MKDTKLYAVNGITMILVFFICRILVFPYVFLCYARYANINFFTVFTVIPRKCIVGCAVLFSLQLYWFCLMAAGAMKHFGRSERKRKIE